MLNNDDDEKKGTVAYVWPETRQVEKSIEILNDGCLWNVIWMWNSWGLSWLLYLISVCAVCTCV
jgi:hypothetical protein